MRTEIKPDGITQGSGKTLMYVNIHHVKPETIKALAFLFPEAKLYRNEKEEKFYFSMRLTTLHGVEVSIFSDDLE